MKRIFIAILVLLCALPVLAQDTGNPDAVDADAGNESNSAIERLIQNQLSTPNRQIRLNGVSGALTSNATIEAITIADRDGIWLRLADVQIVWTRLALLRGRLEVNRLTAGRLEVIRRPLPDDSLPSPEARSFRLPELPVSINIQAFEIASAFFGAEVFGLASQVSVNGAIALQDGSLDTELAVDRTDGPGGQFLLDASYTQETEQLDIDLQLQEPENGILANSLNIEGRPDISLTLAGSGPLGNIDLDFAFNADSRRVLTGTARLRRDEAGLRFTADLSGPVGDIVPASYRQFFGPETRLSTEGLVKNKGGFAVERFDLNAAQLSVEASADTANGFLQRLDLRGRISAADGETVLLPVSGGQTRLRNALVEIDFGSDAGGVWSASIEADDFSANELEFAEFSFTADGTAQPLADRENRNIVLRGSGSVIGVKAADPAVAQALGETIELLIDGRWTAGTPFVLRELSLSARQLLVAMRGEVANNTFSGDLSIDTADLAPFSGLIGQDISGSASIKAEGDVEPLSGAFDLTVDGELGELRLENETLDGLLQGTTTMEGGFARTESGFDTREFRIANSQFTFTADGAFATGSSDFDFEAVINDLSAIAEEVSGKLTANGFARGTDGQIGLSANIEIPQGTLFNKPLTAANLGFSGSRNDGTITGQLVGGADLDTEPVALKSEIVLRRDGTRSFDRLLLSAPGAEITGAIAQDAKGLIDGSLDVDAPDIATLASLLLQEASGAIQAQLVLSSEDDRQDGSLDATLEDVSFGTIRVASGRADVQISDMLDVPKAQGSIRATGIVAGGTNLSRVDIEAERSGDETSLVADAEFDNGARGAMRGLLAPFGEGFSLDLQEFSLRQQSVEAILREPSRLTIADDTIAVDSLRLSVGEGSLTLSGEIGQQVALDLRVDALPLDIANAVRPELGLQGTVNGSAVVDGPREQPRIRFDAKADNVSASELREADLRPISVTANGETLGDRLSLSMEATNSDGVQARASGKVPLAQGTLDMVVQGQAPLALVDRFLEERGAQIAGTLAFDIAISGPPEDPILGGNISAANAQFFDPQTGVRLRDITLAAQLSQSAIQFNEARASLGDGGTVTASGQILLDTNFPTDLEIALADARYQQEDLLTVMLNGNLSVSGELLRDPLISGTISVEEAEILVPERLGGGAVGVEVTHISPSPRIARTLERARTGGAVPIPTARPSIVQLDIVIEAPRRVFVRGRGLDAELGGRLKIVGPINDIRPVGGFELIRGRVSILGQRIVFDEGSVQLAGTLDPILRFVARTSRSDITVAITVSGRASNPEIVLSSQPELPEDEILAQLIFNRGLNELSALQIARLAAAAAELAGSGSSLTGKLRDATGLDDIDIYTNEEGETGVRAGRYIRENIYLGVEAGSNGETRGTVNLDLTDTLKAKGSVSSDGSSDIGLFFEKDY